AATDENGDGRPDIVTGAGAGGVPACRVFDGTTLAPVSDTLGFDPAFTGGLCVAGTVRQPIAGQKPDAVLPWKALGLGAIRAGKPPPPMAARALAIMHLAVYEAVNAIAPLHEFYRGNPGPRPSADLSAAAAAAAHKVLDTLYPGQSATFDAAFAAALGTVT